jgi:uncharacterized membrane protein
MVVMIILNIILIIALTILVLYIFKNNKNNTENVCVNDKCSVESNEDNQNNLNSERVFVGRFVTEDEYQQMMKNRKSDISILLDEVNSEYEHLKELSK